MGTLWQELRYGARMLVKNAAVSAIAIDSLALEIGANTTIFTVVNAVLLNPLPVRHISTSQKKEYSVNGRTLMNFRGSFGT